jgi:hypothetical protein
MVEERPLKPELAAHRAVGLGWNGANQPELTTNHALASRNQDESYGRRKLELRPDCGCSNETGPKNREQHGDPQYREQRSDRSLDQRQWNSGARSLADGGRTCARERPRPGALAEIEEGIGGRMRNREQIFQDSKKTTQIGAEKNPYELADAKIGTWLAKPKPVEKNDTGCENLTGSNQNPETSRQQRIEKIEIN